MKQTYKEILLSAAALALAATILWVGMLLLPAAVDALLTTKPLL